MKGLLMIMFALLAVAAAAPSSWRSNRPLAEDILPDRVYRPDTTTRDVSGIPLVQNSPFDPSKFREFMANYSECMGFYGGAVSVVSGGKILFADGFGKCDAKGLVKCTNKTAFGVASSTYFSCTGYELVSKSFTGMLAGIMQKEGKINVDNRVSDYIPGFKLQDPIASEEVRLVDLLCHRTGLPRHDEGLMDSPMNREELVFAARYLPPSAAFRDKWQYNNWMFVVAGYAMEAVTGYPWEHLVREKVLDPLGMNHTYANFAEAIAAHDEFMSEAVFPVAKGVYTNFMPLMTLFDNIGPAGTMCSDAIEFAKYMNAHLRHRQDVVPDSLINSIHTATMTTPLATEFTDKATNDFAEFSGKTYGNGLMYGSYKGLRTIQHKDVGIFVTSTGGTGAEFFREIIVQYLADSVIGLTPSFKTSDDVCNYPCSLYPTLQMCAQPDEPLYAPPPPVRQSKTATEMQEYVGSFRHPAYGTMNVTYTLGESSLGVRWRTNSPEMSYLRATPYVGDTFGLSSEYPGYENQNYSQIMFFRNLDRKVVGYSWHVAGQPAITFTNPNYEPVSQGYGYAYATSTVFMPSSVPGPKGDQGSQGSQGPQGSAGSSASSLLTYIIGALAAVGFGLAGFVAMTANKSKRSAKLLGDSGTAFVPLLK